MLVREEDLKIIDEAAEPNRSAFMISAAREAALRVRRTREDDEIERICAESARRDQALSDEFAHTLGDGL